MVHQGISMAYIIYLTLNHLFESKVMRFAQISTEMLGLLLATTL